MSYQELTDDNTVFEGVKFNDRISSFITINNKTYTIRGFTPCPHCGGHIAPSYVTQHWKCINCQSIWDSNQYLELLLFERELTRELEDIEHSPNLD